MPLTKQLHALNHSFEAFQDSVERLNARIALATEQLGQIGAQMRMLVESDPELHRKTKYAVTIPGVNFVTAITVTAETDGFANISNRRQLVSYVDACSYEGIRYAFLAAPYIQTWQRLHKGWIIYGCCQLNYLQ